MADDKKIKYHALVLTAENTLIYASYDEPMSHLQVYEDFNMLGIQVKDCIMEQAVSYNLASAILKVLSNWVIRNYDSDLDTTSVSIRSYQHKHQYIITEISGKTSGGHHFSVKPSEVISPKNNFFADFS